MNNAITEFNTNKRKTKQTILKFEADIKTIENHMIREIKRRREEKRLKDALKSFETKKLHINLIEGIVSGFNEKLQPSLNYEDFLKLHSDIINIEKELEGYDIGLEDNEDE